MKPVNLIYFGSPQFSADILEYIISSLPQVKVVAVVTNPDRPQGRKQILTPSPVAQVAASHHLPTFKPAKLDSANLAHLRLLKPDLFLTAAYGHIVPQNYLDLPTIAPLNLHFSLLPRYRGALCLSEPIKNQDQKTGVTLMEMDAELDHGPIISQITQNIDDNDNISTLSNKLTHKAQELLNSTLPLYLDFKQNKITPKTKLDTDITLYLPPAHQDHSQATFTPATSTRTHQNAFVPYNQIQSAQNGNQASATLALINSLNPDPGAWTTHPKGTSFKIISSSIKNDQLQLETIQIPGKNPIPYSQFLNQI